MKRWRMVLGFLMLVGLPWHLGAATCTWDGGGADNYWKTKENWSGDVAPVSGNDLVFAGSTRLTAVNDFPADTFFTSLTFDAGAGAFTLSGNRISTNVLTNQSATVLQTVNLDITSNGLWIPTTLGASLALWLDADDASTINIATGVSAWQDKSGNSRHALQNTASLQPAYIASAINGKPALRFSQEGGAAQDQLAVSFAVTQNNLTVFVVAQKPASSGSDRHRYARVISFWNTGNEPQGIGDHATTNAWIPAFLGQSDTFGGVAPPNVVNWRKGVSTVQAWTYGVAHIIGSSINGSNTTLRLDGTQTTGTTSATALNANEMLVGASPAGIDGEMYGDIAEVIVTPALSTAEQNTLEGYLAWKWGLQGNLPGGHPYLSQAPQSQVSALTITSAAGGLAIGGVLSGSFSLVKAGTGPLTLSGTDTYSGGTTISAGTLTLSGTASSSAFAVSGGNLRGSGTCGALTLTSVGVAPGTTVSKGILTASGNTNLSAGGTLTLRVAGYPTAGTDYDRLASTGTLTLGGSSALTLDLNGLASAGTASGIVTCSGSPTGIFTTINLSNNPNGYVAFARYVTGGVDLCIGNPGSISSVETADLNGNGFLDAIHVTCSGTVDDASLRLADFSVAGTSGLTFSSTTNGDTAGDSDFYLTFDDGLLGSGATPNLTFRGGYLRDVAGTVVYQSYGPTATVDRAKPVLLSVSCTDNDANGVDAGDTLTLTFSENVASSSMVVADLGLPVSGDSLAGGSIANQSGSNQITVTLGGTPLLTPGGAYSSSTTTAGKPSGLYIATGTHVADGAANTAATGTGPTARDVAGSDTIGLAWVNGGTAQKVWALNMIECLSTWNTEASTLDLAIRSVGDKAVRLVVKAAASSPSGWVPDTAAGANKYLMKAHTGTAPVTPSDPAGYELTLSASNQELVAFPLYSGQTQDWQLFFQAPASISTGVGVPQDLVITLTAEVPP